MGYRVAVEDIEPSHYVAWVLDLPGCYSSAPTLEAALAAVPVRIGAYYAWLASHDASLPVVSGPYAVEVVDACQAFRSESDPEYLVNAFFADDARPLGYWEVAVASRLLRWTRQDLLAVVRPLGSQALHRPLPGEVQRSIAGVLDHVIRAENWYLGQLDAALDRAGLPGGVLEGLQAVRAHTLGQLAGWVNDGRITEDRGERWSARKLLRRTLWHERDHTQHVARLAARMR